jgi:branched-chain amino acid transport system substrate-binding protein
MTRSSRPWRFTAVVGLVGLTLAGCAGADEPAADAAYPSSSGPAQGDGELVIGTLLPQTGNLIVLGPGEFAGVELAVREINKAGGVLGKPVRKIDSDSGDTSTDIASQSVNRLLSEKVDTIIGAASSGVSFTVIDKITGAGVVQISGANTSSKFTDYPDQGRFFRTAPSDVLQGRVMGETVVGDGFLDVAILALDDPYGTGLAEHVEKSLVASGGKVVLKTIYDPKAASYSAEVSKVAAAKPEALVLIGFDETRKIIPELVAQGIGPKKLPTYFVDGNLGDYSKDFAKGTLTGVKGTLPGAELGDGFRERLLEVDPELNDFSYGPEAYDATVLAALAAVAAKNDSGTAIASRLVDISKVGTKCTTFAGCTTLLAAGTDIDYDGVSGPVEFSDKGDPTEATIGIYRYGPDNTFKNLEYRSGKI